MKSCAVVLGLVVGIIISVGAGYFDNSPITAAPAATFIWVKTFPLTVSGPIVLPFLAVFLILMMEAIGDITATCDVSRYSRNSILLLTIELKSRVIFTIPESKEEFSRTVI